MITDDMRRAACEEYASKHLGSLEEEPPFDPLSPAEVQALLWTFNPMFVARSEALEAEAYSSRFETTAEGALLALARNDDLSEWEKMPAGAWRVLRDWHHRALCMTVKAELADEPVILHLPRGFPAYARPRAALLWLLLGPRGPSLRRPRDE